MSSQLQAFGSWRIILLNSDDLGDDGDVLTRVGENAAAFRPGGGGGAAWGGITGTLSAQTDLQAALDAKSPAFDQDLNTDDDVVFGSMVLGGGSTPQLLGSTASNFQIATPDSATDARPIQIFPGNATDINSGGNLDLEAGDSTGGTGGHVDLFAGNGVFGGEIEIEAGNGTTGDGGNIDIDAGDSSDGGSGGRVNITSGDGASAGEIQLLVGSTSGLDRNGSNLNLKAGQGTGTGSGGTIRFFSGTTGLDSNSNPNSLSQLMSVGYDVALSAPALIFEAGAYLKGINNDWLLSSNGLVIPSVSSPDALDLAPTGALNINGTPGVTNAAIVVDGVTLSFTKGILTGVA